MMTALTDYLPDDEARALYKLGDAAHDFDHVWRVTAMAIRLARGEVLAVRGPLHAGRLGRLEVARLRHQPVQGDGDLRLPVRSAGERAGRVPAERVADELQALAR